MYLPKPGQVNTGPLGRFFGLQIIPDIGFALSIAVMGEVRYAFFPISFDPSLTIGVVNIEGEYYLFDENDPNEKLYKAVRNGQR